jgi:hypothetical protein
VFALWLTFVIPTAAGCALTLGDPASGYSDDPVDAIGVFNRGDGPTAMVSFEKKARTLDEAGRRVGAAKVQLAVMALSWRLGSYEVGITAGRRALEGLSTEGQSPETLPLKANTCDLLVTNCMGAGDVDRARHYATEDLRSYKVRRFGDPISGAQLRRCPCATETSRRGSAARGSQKNASNSISSRKSRSMASSPPLALSAVAGPGGETRDSATAPS